MGDRDTVSRRNCWMMFEISDMAGLELYQVAVESLFPQLASSPAEQRTLRSGLHPPTSA
jgi:hypothetical protein